MVLEWQLLASPPVMRVRCTEGWCTEREMDGGLNLVGETHEPPAAGAALSAPSGRRKSVSVMSAQERQALRRASVDIAQKQLQTHMLFRDGEIGRTNSSGALKTSPTSRRLLNGTDGDSPTATTCVSA